MKLIEKITKLIELVRNLPSSCVEPELERVQGFGNTLTGPHTAGLFAADDPGIFENREVLADRGQRHVERRSEFTDGCRTFNEAFEQRQAGWISEGAKTIERLLMVKHVLEYLPATRNGQVIS